MENQGRGGEGTKGGRGGEMGYTYLFFKYVSKSQDHIITYFGSFGCCFSMNFSITCNTICWD